MDYATDTRTTSHCQSSGEIRRGPLARRGLPRAPARSAGDAGAGHETCAGSLAGYAGAHDDAERGRSRRAVTILTVLDLYATITSMLAIAERPKTSAQDVVRQGGQCCESQPAGLASRRDCLLPA